MYSIYLDFTQLLLISQLTCLPCLPRDFVKNLNNEWNFSNEVWKLNETKKIAIKVFMIDKSWIFLGCRVDRY